MRLSDLQTGEKGYITKVLGHGALRKRIVEMGFVKGKVASVVLNAPLKDPIKYQILDCEISLRRNEAELIEVVLVDEHTSLPEVPKVDLLKSDTLFPAFNSQHKEIHVAFVGNPNAGKTTLFNSLTGAKEHVGNYSGVTVGAAKETLHYKGYNFSVYDLPGTYSLSAYSPEERYVRDHITQQHPDIVINVVDGTNLERNLFLTTQLMDMDQRIIMSINMYDELERSTAHLDIDQLSTLLGMPIVKTSAKFDRGVSELLDKAIEVFEERNDKIRHIHVNHGPDLERGIKEFNDQFKQLESLSPMMSPRHMAIKFLERDVEIEELLRGYDSYVAWKERREDVDQVILSKQKDSTESAIMDAKYAYVSGALRETFIPGKETLHQMTKSIDEVVTSPFLGYPIFIGLIWLMFTLTFSVGQYPMDWIEQLVEVFSGLVTNFIPKGVLRDLIVDGIIGGVGGVIVFLPNILILYFCISFLEDSGYMARVAFIMDKLMHKVGLHGKSFIPLVMGFGCTVPSIMAARTIEDPKSRLITILINPLISCSARLPIYILIVGTFFPGQANLVLMGIYVLGIVLAMLVAKIFSKYIIRGEDHPFVMELPPYRVPTMKNTIQHMWENTRSYLSKMGGTILIASIVVWFLGYFPRMSTVELDQYQSQRTQIEQTYAEQVLAFPALQDSLTLAKEEAIETSYNDQAFAQQRDSYIGQVGSFFEPIFAPLGFNWKINVALLSGVAAKEIVVSTLGVLYAEKSPSSQEHKSLSERLREDGIIPGKPDFTPLIALSFLVFVLSYFPCLATIVAIVHEANSVKWGIFAVCYTTAIGWFLSFLVYQLGMLFLS